MKASIKGILPAAVITLIAVCSFFLARDIIFFGDDINYYVNFVRLEATWKGLPITMHVHWDENNGRMGDMLAPIPLNLLSINGRACLNALMTALFFTIPLLLLRFRQQKLLLRMVTLALLTFTLRWDSLWMENIANQDYVWTLAYTLTIMLAILRSRGGDSRWWQWLLMPFCMAAGWMHEALGLPLAAGLIAYSFSGNFFRKSNAACRGMILAFITGALLSFSNANNFAKFEKTVDYAVSEPIWQLLLTSAYWVLVLIVVIIAMACGGGRKRLLGLIRGEWIVWTVSAFVSTGFMIVVSYGGRTGWFAQIFAMMALLIIAADYVPKIKRCVSISVSLLLAVMISAQYVAMVFEQHRLSAESRSIIAQLRESSTGTIFADYSDESQLPWYLQRKLHAFPDEDDTYYRWKSADLYSPGRQITILPAAARALNFDTLQSRATFGEKVISPTRLQGEEIAWSKFGRKIRVLKIGGSEVVESEFRVKPNGRTYYLYTPRDFDYIDR